MPIAFPWWRARGMGSNLAAGVASTYRRAMDRVGQTVQVRRYSGSAHRAPPPIPPCARA
jgi:hypothetical protein